MLGLLDERCRDCIVNPRCVVASRQCAGTFRDRGADVNVATWQGESRFTIDKVAEPVVRPVRNVHPLPRGLDPVTAAMTEPAACCLAGLETFQMPRGATVLVIGGGIMGLVTMMLARRRGARRLILSDPIEERRQMARRLGASVVIDPVHESVRDKVMELTGGRGADVVCEAVGKAELVAEGLALTRPMGFVQLVGVNPKGSRLPLDLWDVHFREIRIGGAFGRGTAYRRALALMPKLGLKRLVTARFPLEGIREAFAHAAAGQGVKTMITSAKEESGEPPARRHA